MSLIQELQRRNVFKVAVAYIVVAWLVAQVLELAFDSFGAPEWVMKTVLVLLAAGLLFAVIFAWAFEMTPEGLKRERDVERTESITPQTGRKLNHLILGLMGLALVYFAIDKFMLRAPAPEVAPTTQATTDPTPAAPAAEPDKSVAVLPFVDMSPDKDQEYFTDGLTENLLNALAQLSELKVAGRTSSFAFKGRNEDLRSIGQQLGVAHLLEGSVQKSGNRVRITAQLVKAGDGYHLWSRTYDRTLEDVFAVQDEIAGEVAQAMQVTLLGGAGAGPAKVSHETGEAYNDYLKGLYERNRGTMESNKTAIEHFRRALEEDPELALAWAGLSLAQAFVTGYEDNDFVAGFEEARASALRALELDPDLPEGHVALAGIQSSLDWDWAAAEASLKRALALRPGDVEIRSRLARLLEMRGHPAEALAEARRVAEQNPLDWSSQNALAATLARSGKLEEAQAAFERTRQLDGDRPVLYWGLGNLRLSEGDPQRALEEYQQEKFRFLSLTGQAIAYHRLGQREQSVATLQALISETGESSSYQIAEVYAQWGDADNAMIWLERGYKIRDPGLQYMLSDKFFDPIKNDPRFQAFLERMNFNG